MPPAPCALPPTTTCCFSGRAAAITIHGDGLASFLAPAPLSDARAARVDLVGASIPPREGTGVSLLAPAFLEPLPMSFPDQAYTVTYASAGAAGPVTIALDLPAPTGQRASSTTFRGPLEGAPACATTACAIDWHAPVKKLSLLRADLAPRPLTPAFPGKGGHLGSVKLEGAHGLLRCKADGGIHEETIDGKPLQWSTAQDGALVVEPIALEGHLLAVSVANSSPPTQEAESIPKTPSNAGPAIGPLALLGGLAVLAAVAVAALVRRRSSTVTVTITGSTVGAVAVGEGATSTGHVHAAQSAPPTTEPNPPPSQAPPSGPAESDRIRVLLVFSNPKGTTPLRLGDEDRAVRESIQLARERDRIDVEALHAASIDDLRRALIKKPRTVVHFSGHGEPEGLCFQGASGEAEFPDANALAALLRSRGVETVILNACYARSLIEDTPMGTRYTVAMEGKLSDAGAIEFSRGFYDVLGAGGEVPEAYEEGLSCAKVKRTPVEAALIPTPAETRTSAA